MPQNIRADISAHYCNTHQILLELVATLTDEQIRWTPNATTPSIGFHVWHVARWADYLQEIINGRGNQFWETEGMATQWDMETDSLGYAQTGMSMDDTTAVTLRMPKKETLLGYAQRALVAAQQAVASISDQDFYKVYECFHGEDWHDGQIGPIISTWMTHDNRHLGMIECLVGVQGTYGSADS